MNANRVLKVVAGAGAVALVLSVGLVIAQEDWSENEAAAVAALRTITTSESVFREGDKEQDGNLDYGMLSELSNTTLVDSVLGSGTKHGYLFQVSYSCTTSEFLWWATASPEKPGETGDTYFFTNAAGVVFSSKKPITFNPETCEVPKGLTPWAARPVERSLVRDLGALAGADGLKADKVFDGIEVGQSFTLSGVGQRGDLVLKVESKTDKEVVYSISGDGADRKETWKLATGKSRFKSSGVTEVARKKLRDDSVIVSGVQIPCVVFEMKQSPMNDNKLIVWASPDRFPFVVKILDESEHMQLELKQIQGAKSTLAPTCKCGAAFEANDKFCAKCGLKRPGMVVAICPSCGASFKADAKFCSQCGKARPE